MSIMLSTNAEKYAEAAENLEAFRGLKLLNIKENVASMLNLIGKGDVFYEYTLHDISHIDAMLEMLDWIIDDDTKETMTATDWLLIVLAIYFHDLGMLVTKSEFDNRARSGVYYFRDNNLFAGEEGSDYKIKIEQLSEINQERFIYQEYIRHIHAQRIKYWILGSSPREFGVNKQAADEINKMLEPLGNVFKKDLALVCESHHLDDLDNFDKYSLSEPFGRKPTESANIFFAALLLRTVDLLHITKDRTPPIVFRLIDPTDPISQEEWAKQMAVNCVRHKPINTLDVSSKKYSDTIEVHAYFKEENGFFSLNSYLKYVEEQLDKCYNWGMAAKKRGSKYLFNWRFIDDTKIQTEGFERQTFRFTLHERNILEMLTGHTLYNDTSVVLRELVQNALDAVRLQHYVDKEHNINSNIGGVEIFWDSAKRVLSVKDNGTGMTQEIIEKHLLNIGSSRYQAPEFKKRYPNFSSISRFGIGILSTFMVADRVEITTYHPEESEIKQLTLRSVHGRYLIRKIDKTVSDDILNKVLPHGTIIKLFLRQKAEMHDPVELARKWIVFPGCDVRVKVDGGEPIQIGFDNPKSALKEALEKTVGAYQDEKTIKIKEVIINGVNISFALHWSEFFKEWEYITINRDSEKKYINNYLGVCIEGIRVENSTPGYSQKAKPLLALCNITGSTAPKTNVARSGIEVTPECNNALSAIYSSYLKHIADEIDELVEKRGFSLTWAMQEARYILAPLLEGITTNQSIFYDCVNNLPIFLCETKGERFKKTARYFQELDFFWTIDSQLFTMIENLMRELKVSVTMTKLIQAICANEYILPCEPIYCGYYTKHVLERIIFKNKEIEAINIYPEQRRVDLRWSNRSEPSSWVSIDLIDNSRLELAKLKIKTNIGDEFIGVTSADRTFLFNNNPLNEHLIKLCEKSGVLPQVEDTSFIIPLLVTITHMIYGRYKGPFTIEYVRTSVSNVVSQMPILRGAYDATEINKMIDGDLIKALNGVDLTRVFNTSVWRRNW